MMIEGDGDKELPDADEVTHNRVEERENVVKDCEFMLETVNGGVQSGDVGTLQDKGAAAEKFCDDLHTCCHVLTVYLEIANMKLYKQLMDCKPGTY
ncbi:hypothetical protein HAX54_018261 [Datura stramonium]|uniref:Uncharacterized protein n=1 Tax=Datura stramonium TaxID=4076 RepID=A0ABS8S159_DATST|nr:hypothetical protein [Datura stramonium]